jgi:hypothetical protein
MASRGTVVGYHPFETYAGHPGKDGANFDYVEQVELVEADGGVVPRPHNLVDLCRSDAAAREALGGVDVVMTTVGPHAYFYFYLRERLGLNFRIVRDVRTAFWNGYLQQESLCASYLRADDMILHASRYSMGVFDTVFPHLVPEAQAVCYPILHSLPPEAEGSWVGSGWSAASTTRPRRIGFVGRLTDDKNYGQALALLDELRRRWPGRYELHAVGERPPGVPGPASDTTDYRWFPPVDRSAIWSMFREMDVLFFPSTSSLETFGRVLVEASYVGTPILSSSHAATSELLPETSLVGTRYRTDLEFTTHLAGRLGDVDVERAADLLGAGEAPPRATGYHVFRGHDRYLIDLLRRGPEAVATDAMVEPTPLQRDFLSSVQMSNLSTSFDQETADDIIAGLRSHFVALHRRGSLGYFATLATLLARSRYRGKTMDFVRRSLVRGEDFTNIGGIDLQFSHLIGYEPRFRIKV